MTTQPTGTTRVPEIPKNVPLSSTWIMERVLNFDKFSVRWFNFSSLIYMTFRNAGLKALPPLLMIIKGRKSGKWIETPICSMPDGDRFVVVASFGGSPTHPIWFRNLEANPDCKVHTRWKTHTVRARVAQGEERAQLWNRICSHYPGYNDYATKAAPREIPVVVFEKQ